MEQAGAYDNRCDIWSLGITTLELGKGTAPYSNHSAMRVLVLTIEGEPPSLRCYGEDRGTDKQRTSAPFSKEFEDFCSQCLKKNPRQRLTAEKLLDHKFLRNRSRYALVDQLLRFIPPVDASSTDTTMTSSSENISRRRSKEEQGSSPPSPGSFTADIEDAYRLRMPGNSMVAIERLESGSKQADSGIGLGNGNGSEDRAYIPGSSWIFEVDDTSTGTSISTVVSTSKQDIDRQGGSSGNKVSLRISGVRGSSCSTLMSTAGTDGTGTYSCSGAGTTWRVTGNGFETEEGLLREGRGKEEQKERIIGEMEEEVHVHDDSAVTRGPHTGNNNDIHNNHIRAPADNKETIEAFLEDFESEAATMTMRTTKATAAAVTSTTSISSNSVSGLGLASTAEQATASVPLFDCSSSSSSSCVSGSKQGRGCEDTYIAAANLNAAFSANATNNTSVADNRYVQTHRQGLHSAPTNDSMTDTLDTVTTESTTNHQTRYAIIKAITKHILLH